MKLQISFEFLLILGALLVIILPIIYFIYSKSSEVSDDLRLVKLKYAINNLNEITNSVLSTKGEVKVKILLPSYSALSIKRDGDMSLISGYIYSNDKTQLLSVLTHRSNDLVLNNSLSSVDSEIVLRVFYNVSNNDIAFVVFE